MTSARALHMHLDTWTREHGEVGVEGETRNMFEVVMDLRVSRGSPGATPSIGGVWARSSQANSAKQWEFATKNAIGLATTLHTFVNAMNVCDSLGEYTCLRRDVEKALPGIGAFKCELVLEALFYAKILTCKHVPNYCTPGNGAKKGLKMLGVTLPEFIQAVGAHCEIPVTVREGENLACELYKDYNAKARVRAGETAKPETVDVMFKGLPLLDIKNGVVMRVG